MWNLIEEHGVKHVIPVDDLREHVERSDCWCEPTIDDEVHNMYVHHSLDRREFYEQSGIKQ